jgi:hypothetical protein
MERGTAMTAFKVGVRAGFLQQEQVLDKCEKKFLVIS